MPIVETEAIILQNRKFSETSKILTVFALEQGRVSLLVKGGRKGVKKFPGGLESLNRVTLQYYHKPSRELQNYKNSDLVDPYRGIKSDLRRTFTGLSLAEIVLRATAAEDANAVLYQNFLDAFAALDRTGENPWTLRWKALLQFCKAFGFSLELNGCSVCGQKEQLVAFNLRTGGFVCRGHQSRDEAEVGFPAKTWGILRFLWNCTYAAAPRMSVPSAVGRQIEALFYQYYQYHIPGLRSLESWKKLPALYWGEKEG